MEFSTYPSMPALKSNHINVFFHISFWNSIASKQSKQGYVGCHKMANKLVSIQELMLGLFVMVLLAAVAWAVI